MNDKNAESGHWYDKKGNPAYTIIGANGAVRNTTLRDAKMHNLVPSVTTILGVCDKPGLTRWLQQQVLLAALTLPRHENESEEDWLDRVIQDSRSTGRAAADRGTRMHGVLEQFYLSTAPGVWPLYVIETDRAITEHFGDQTWCAEASFARDGYGGKVDLHCEDDEHIVIDFKTKEGSLDKVTSYPEHLMQLAAYRNGLCLYGARCANVFVNEQGDVKIIEHSEEDLSRAMICFNHLLAFYRIKNKL